jgi:hypothetical protein
MSDTIPPPAPGSRDESGIPLPPRKPRINLGAGPDLADSVRDAMGLARRLQVVCLGQPLQRAITALVMVTVQQAVQAGMSRAEFLVYVMQQFAVIDGPTGETIQRLNFARGPGRVVPPATPELFDDAVDQWHRGVALHEWLGLTLEEYAERVGATGTGPCQPPPTLVDMLDTLAAMPNNAARVAYTASLRAELVALLSRLGARVG